MVSLMVFSKKRKYSLTDYRVVKKSIDTSFYMDSHQDLIEAAERNRTFDPVKHYLEHGWWEGRNPTPDFCSAGYLHFHPDVARSGMNPFVHYLRFGHREKRYVPKPDEFQSYLENYKACEAYFDVQSYWDTYPLVRERVGRFDSALLLYDYMTVGWRDGYNPSQNFNTTDYLFLNPDVRAAGINPLYHYTTSGIMERRPTRLRSISADYADSPRALFVGHSANPSGAEIMLLDVLKWYKLRTSYQTDLILLSGGTLLGQYNDVTRVAPLNGVEDFPHLISSKFLREKYDVIYLNTVVSVGIVPGLLNIFGANIPPIVLHVHEMSSLISQYVDQLREMRPYISKYIFASDRAYDDYQGLIGIDSSLAEVMYSFVPAPHVPIVNIKSQRTAAREDLGLPLDATIVCMSGTVYPRKGPDLFLEVASKVVSVNRHVIFIWFGDGLEVEAYRQQVINANLQQHVFFLGHSDRSRDLIAAANIFFLSSREDPFPLVCLEAARFAIPTVHFQGVTGIDLLTKQGAGVSVDAFDTSHCASTILDLIDSPARTEEIGVRAKHLVSSNYSLEPAMLLHLRALREVASLPPAVSVIVPNYNHARFLSRRLRSICDQTYADLEILVLDDASTDDSIAVISSYQQDPRLRLIANKVNSGSPFLQWNKGAGEAKGSLIWIAESDDECTFDFLERLLPAFKNSDCVISYCRTDTINEFGVINSSALDAYMDEDSPRFKSAYYISGSEEINSGLGYRCTLVNASSAVFRAKPLREAISSAFNYRLCGDWRVYVEILKFGSVSYIPDRLNYFRRHSSSTIHRLEGSSTYFSERLAIAEYVASNYEVTRQVAYKMVAEIEREWHRFKDRHPFGTELVDFIDLNSLEARFGFRPKRRPVVAFYVHGYLFSKGGIEQQVAAISRRLAQRGYEVYIFCRVWGDATPLYDAGGLVRIVPIYDENDNGASIKRVAQQLCEKEIDVFIPMLSEWLFEPMAKAARKAHVSLIVSEHNDPWEIESRWWSHDARMKTFSLADRVHLLMPNFLESLDIELQSKSIVIPNGIELGYAPRNWKVNPPCHTLIAVGRLVEQKGFGRLIEAMELVVKKLPDCRLDIFGEGPLRTELETMVKYRGLEKNVFLRGRSDDILAHISAASALVVPSYFEGFGIVIAEAKSVGVPSIAFQTCNGANQLIRNGIDGVLVGAGGQIEDLALAIEQLLNEPGRLVDMGECALIDAQNYNIDRLVDLWEAMICDVAFERGR